MDHLKWSVGVACEHEGELKNGSRVEIFGAETESPQDFAKGPFKGPFKGTIRVPLKRYHKDPFKGTISVKARHSPKACSLRP